MMKKDYELLARAIARQMRAAPEDVNRVLTLRSVARELASALAQDNPKFDEARFLQACGVPNNEEM